MHKREKWKRIIAGLLVITMFGTSISLEGLAADTQPDSSVEPSVESEEQDEAYVPSLEDVIEEEKTEDSTTYNAGDGVWVTEFYGQKVRFTDENGELMDYDASLTEVEDEASELGNGLEAYRYENTAGDKKLYLPEKLAEDSPILMEYGCYQIRLTPMGDGTAELAENASVTETVIG